VNAVAVTTPVTAGRAEGLSAYLNSLPRDQPPTSHGPAPGPRSPFSGALPPTHFARFAVIELDDDLYLFFTACFDSVITEYLRSLAVTAQAQTIWGHCQLECHGDTPTARELEHYLCDQRNWRSSQYVVSALPSAVTVAQINRALSLRGQLAGLVARAADSDPTGLAHDFRQLPAIRALLR
jgi:hypothetical protein